jgi:hypothetical protein
MRLKPFAALAALPVVALATGAAGPMWTGPFQDLPPGSYQQTCRDITAFNDTVYARCLTSNGGWWESQVNFRACPGARVANYDGRLRCEGGGGGYPGGGGYDPGPPPPPPWSNGCRPNQSPGLLIFENPDYKGVRQELCDSSRDLAGSGLDDAITSVRVLRGQWQLCAGRDFNGQCWTVDADTPNLKTLNANDKVSSIRRLRP